MILRSAVTKELKQRLLFKGTLLASIGGIILLIAPLAYGFPLFLLAMAFITWGLLPYRQLTRLENRPLTLTFQDDDTILFSQQKIPILTLPISAIASASFYQNGQMYGIAIHLKDKAVIHNKRLARSYINQKSFDIVFYYFSKRSYDSFQDIIN